MEPDSFVIGEAVELEVRLAHLPSRALAFAIDAAVQMSAFAILALIGGALLGGGDLARALALITTATVAVLVGYPVALETLWKGRTLGKAALGLRVVRDDGGVERFRHALVRGLCAAFIDIWSTSGVVAVVVSLSSSRGKRVGDLLAGTVVISERVAARPEPPVPMPPPLAAWATTLDLSRLDDGLALAARQFLTRAPRLRPAAREEVGSQLVRAVAAVVTPPAPPGTPGWAYIAAVLAERRRRSESLLQANRARPSTVSAPPPVAAPPPPTAAPPSSASDGFAPPG